MKKKKPLGRAIELPEAQSEEIATPTEQDISRADALAEADPVLSALWNADTYKTKEDAE